MPLSNEENEKQRLYEHIKNEESKKRRTFFHDTFDNSNNIDVMQIENHMVVNFPDY